MSDLTKTSGFSYQLKITLDSSDVSGPSSLTETTTPLPHFSVTTEKPEGKDLCARNYFKIKMV